MYHFFSSIDDHSEVVLSKKTTFISNPTEAASEFASILSLIEKILEKDEAENLSAIKSVCRYVTRSSDSGEPMFSEEQLREIRACANLQNILLKLRQHWRWDDHLLLTTILYRLDSEACEELLGRYQSKIDCQMRLEEIFNECKKQQQEIPEGFSKMVTIVNKKYLRITKEEYEQLKCFIAEHCGVEPYVLSPFLNMSQSSLLLEWFIPSNAIAHMVEISIKHKSVFIKQSFTFLQIADVIIFDHRIQVCLCLSLLQMLLIV